MFDAAHSVEKWREISADTATVGLGNYLAPSLVPVFKPLITSVIRRIEA